MKSPIKGRDINSVRNEINEMIEQKVVINTKRHRGKVKTYNGVIKGAYSTYFNIELDSADSNRRVCFNYCDVLTEEISIETLEK